MRASFVKYILLLATVVAVASGFRSVGLPVRLNEPLTNEMSDFPALRPMDSAIDSFRVSWGIRGLGFAVMRNDSLLYAKGYGVDNYGRPMTPGTTNKLASVSKLLTAIAIMELVEEGMFSLQSPVFGPFGVLKGFDDVIQDERHYLITVEHLLRHQGGLYYGAADPMFKTYEIMRELGLSSAPNQTQLARYLLSKPLEFDPGTWQQYSNFGYMLLGMIIEQATGEDYERYMQETIFEPNGCFGFSIARDYTVRILGGGGGWVGSAPELARMVATIDGRGPIADILSEESLKRMAIQGGIDAYPLGWMDSRDGTLTRTGTLAGASLLIKLYPDGTCWIMISNTTTSRRSYFTKDMAELFLQLRGPYNGLFPARDLFSGHSGR